MKKRIMALFLLTIMLLTAFCGCGSSHSHTMSSSIVTEATCTTNGTRQYFCTQCDYTYDESISPAHNYVETVIEKPTCTQKGSSQHTCSVCNDSYIEELSTIAHKYVDKHCSMCGILKVGVISTPYLKTVHFKSAGYTISSARISSVEANVIGNQLYVSISGVKTYDSSGDYSNGPITFMMIIYDSTGSIVCSDQMLAQCVVNQQFEINERYSGFDSTEDYRITLEDYT